MSNMKFATLIRQRTTLSHRQTTKHKQNWCGSRLWAPATTCSPLWTWLSGSRSCRKMSTGSATPAWFRTTSRASSSSMTLRSPRRRPPTTWPKPSWHWLRNRSDRTAASLLDRLWHSGGICGALRRATCRSSELCWHVVSTALIMRELFQKRLRNRDSFFVCCVANCSDDPRKDGSCFCFVAIFSSQCTGSWPFAKLIRIFGSKHSTCWSWIWITWAVHWR